jgi:23S rRNA-/tRNA-specific pseudouridylate synthase
MLLSFNPATASLLHEHAIRNGNKKYIALVRGAWDYDKEIIVDRPLIINEIKKNARTKFTCLATLEGEYERSSLLLCEPLTGRTHQIRRHAQKLGHPIIGDSEHGDSKVNRWWREEKGLNRLALHCFSIEFTLKDETHSCVAPLPESFRQVLQQTLLWQPAVENFPLLATDPYDYRGGSFGRNYKQDDQPQESSYGM